ncbi:MAG TPA: ribokinase [Chloroflexota bacterium]|nr:ribokinase [Chloroflexota bacterium]
MSDGSVVVVGSANMDVVGRVPHLPVPGETVLGSTLTHTPGGKGANQAVAAARAGSRVTFVGHVGDDAYADDLIRSLAGAGVGIGHLTRDRTQPTGVALIMVDDAGQNMIGVLPGANGQVSPEDVEDVAGEITRGSVVLTQLEIPLPTVIRTAQVGRAAGSLAILNPAPARELSLEQLRLFDVVVPNAEELGRLSGIGSPNDPVAGARLLVDAGVRAVVVTLGADGAVVVTADRQASIPPYPVRAVDTVGAGDAFVGNLAHALAAGETLIEAAHWAGAAAALSVGRSGAQTSMPAASETAALLGRAS